jgi:hypothetical protein
MNLSSTPRFPPLSVQNTRRIPLLIKLLYTAFVAVMVPYYWHAYGPRNFLYFCDVAVLVTLAAIWIESPLLISMEAVAILLPQAIWMFDFGTRAMGFKIIGMTDYMFDPRYTVFVRGLSLFHGWLPILLVWLVYRLGYDRRALLFQTIAGIGLLLVCYFLFTPPTPTTAPGPWVANINYVFGMNENAAQTKFPAIAWFGFVLVGIPVLMYVPTHVVLKRIFRASGVAA